MESNLVCKVINKIQWLQRGNNYDYLPITSVIMDRIGLHKVLLPIDHKHYNFWEKKKKHLGQTSLVKCLIKSKSFSILEIPQMWVVVAIVIVINSVFGGFR